MITEDYVSFETAKLLKEKGFDEFCRAHYDITNGNLYYEKVEVEASGCEMHNSVLAPTLQMAMKWLREEKGIAVIPVLSSILDNEKFLWDIKIVVTKTNVSYSQGWVYEEQEDAFEMAIKYCLKNLIET